MDNITFAKQFLEPKRTGNLILDLNPLTKLNICLVVGLSAFFVGDYRYGFGIVILLFVIAAFAKCLKSYIKVYWKVMLMFGVFLFAIKAAFAPGENIIWQKWGIHISVESIQSALVLTSGVLAFCGAVIMFSQTTQWSDLTYALEQKGVSLPKAGAGARLGVGQVVLLIVLKYLCLQYCDSAFVLHRFVLLGCLHFGLPVR